MDDTPLDEETVAKLKQVIDEHTQLCEAEYDGVLGTLPEWVPDSNQKEFQDSRNQLLEHYSHSQILHWIESHISHRLTGELPECSYGQKFIMPDARYNISVLALIKKAVLSGKKKGLGLLAGNLAVKGDSFSQAGGTKKGKYYEPKKSIKIIID